ncbi:MAG TPA: co-chaperone GroES family protein [Bacteroidales bacterium]|nr:co-chaperone GroES family protein [Bacteroidales bacterium]
MDAKTQEIVDKFKGRALNFVVVLKEIENVNETSSGLNISSSVDKNEKYRKAIVVSIGTECPKDGIQLGDTVMYDKHKANPLTQNAVEYVTLFYADLVWVG